MAANPKVEAPAKAAPVAPVAPVKFFCVYGRYCTYVGKIRVQFEANVLITENPDVIAYFRAGKDKNVTEVKAPVAIPATASTEPAK